MDHRKQLSKHQPTGRWITVHKRHAIYLRDKFQCVYCGKDLHDVEPNKITLDHLVARSDGGSNESFNLVTACLSCNSSRQDRPWHSYATGGAVDRIEVQRFLPLNIEYAKALLAGKARNDEAEGAR